MNDQNSNSNIGNRSPQSRGFGPSEQPRIRRAKKRKTFKIILVSAISLLLVIICTGVAIVLPLLQAYNSGYKDVPIITRPDDYTFVIPDLPSLGGNYPTIGENGHWFVGDIDTGIEVEYGELVTDEYGEEYPEILNDPVVGENGNWWIGEYDCGVKAETATEPDITEPDTTTEPDITEPPVTEPPKEPVVVNGIYKVDKKDPDIENILVIGTDSRDMTSLKGRSDTMMVCSYNRRTGEAKLISFMRDMLVPIEGLGKNGGVLWQRLNATFSLSGVACTINTINQLFGLDIQRFVIVNFAGTEKLIDACGGIDLPLTNTPDNWKGEVQWIENSGYKVIDNGDGTYHLDGGAALIYMRYRKDSSDFKRTERQRKAMTALFRQVVSSRDLTEIYDLVREGFNMIQTNIPLNEMIDLAASVVSNGSGMTIGSHRIPKNYKNIYFDIGKQVEVQSGQGGAMVLKIDIEAQKEQVQKYIYGK